MSYSTNYQPNQNWNEFQKFPDISYISRTELYRTKQNKTEPNFLSYLTGKIKTETEPNFINLRTDPIIFGTEKSKIETELELIYSLTKQKIKKSYGP